MLTSGRLPATWLHMLLVRRYLILVVLSNFSAGWPHARCTHSCIEWLGCIKLHVSQLRTRSSLAHEICVYLREKNPRVSEDHRTSWQCLCDVSEPIKHRALRVVIQARHRSHVASMDLLGEFLESSVATLQDESQCQNGTKCKCLERQCTPP